MIAPRHPGLHRVATLPRLRLTCRQFNDLLDYSCSVPTGTTVGKRWKRLDGAHDPTCDDPVWMVGECVECEPPDPKRVRIKWYKPVIVIPAGKR